MSEPPSPLVLIVDDNEKNMKLAREVLRLAGFRTLEASNGAESIELAAAHLPDVILMDIRLPDMDGTAAATRIKDDSRTMHIPVVALTSLAMKGDREQLLAAGFDGYLEKPISVREFPGQVDSFCLPRLGSSGLDLGQPHAEPDPGQPAECAEQDRGEREGRSAPELGNEAAGQQAESSAEPDN